MTASPGCLLGALGAVPGATDEASALGDQQRAEWKAADEAGRGPWSKFSLEATLARCGGSVFMEGTQKVVFKYMLDESAS